MKLADALSIAEKVYAALQPFCEKIEVVGSIRRRKAEVGDIDIVAIAKDVVGFLGPLGVPVDFPADSVWNLLIPKELRKLGLKVEVSGPQLLRAVFADGFQVDVYRAEAETWGVILLVRTGSKEHNVKLCALAKSKGYKLSASQGVLDCYGEVMASTTEERIFEVLGLAFVEPKWREVPY